MNNKGQGTLMSFFVLVMGLIMVVALLPVLDALVGTVKTMNLSNLLMPNMILLLVGISGLIMVILFLMGVISDFQVRQRYVE
jgi:membrane-associated HD superfamily phosphohydrolase